MPCTFGKDLKELIAVLQESQKIFCMGSFGTVAQQRLGKKKKKHKRKVHEELYSGSHMMQGVLAISGDREGKDQL